MIHQTNNGTRQEDNKLFPPNVAIEDETFGLSNIEGVAIFEEILKHPHPHLIISIKPNFINNVASINGSMHIQEQTNNTHNNIYEQLKIIWGNALEINIVNDFDDFFLIGGDSLLSLQITYQIKKQLGIDLEPHWLLSYPIFKDFADKVLNLKKY